MWCRSCGADVAAELSADERLLLCARCGNEIGVSAAALRSKPGATIPAREQAAEVLARWSAEELLSGSSRISVNPPSTMTTHVSAAPIETRTTATRTTHRRSGKSEWIATAAQLTAYLGVFLLTCGTALVITNQFGGTPQRSVNGWLLATIGQMLLFLGVITLVSHGLEQARKEFTTGIRRLNRRLRRLQMSDSTNDTTTERARPNAPQKQAA